MKNHIIFFSLCICHSLYTQNLVLNPSFENHDDYRCTVFLGGFNKSILDWSIPNFGSTDYFDSCSKDMGIKNYNGFQKPKSGNTFAGIYVYTDKNYREYIQGQLSETLIKGETYAMTFYISLADKSSYALKDIDVLFTEEKLKPCYKSNNCEKNIKPLKATKKQFEMYSDNEEKFISDKQNWTEYKFEFVANGYENFFSIGNFYRNSKTEKQKVLSNSPYLFSYYYIDDVSVISSKETIETEGIVEVIPEVKPKIETNKIHTFKNVLFDFDKSELLETSIKELDDLYTYLEVNPTFKVEIYGHTDNVGLESRNQELSEERAKAVADYLISLGLEMSKIKSFGFGSLKPISDNKTEKGRKENRRVAFKLIEN